MSDEERQRRLDALKAQIREKYGRNSQDEREHDPDPQADGGEAGPDRTVDYRERRSESGSVTVTSGSLRDSKGTDSRLRRDQQGLPSSNGGTDQSVQRDKPTVAFAPAVNTEATLPRITSGEPAKKVVDRAKRTAAKAASKVKESIPSVPSVVIESDRRKVSEDEKDKLRKDLIESIQDFGTYLDAIAYAIGRRHENDVIFGNLDNDEAGTLADMWIERAKYSRTTSTQMRTFIRIHDEYIKAGIILGPRLFRYAMKMWTEGVGLG